MVSYNVASLRSVLSSPDKARAFQAQIQRERPDILCLNEHKLKDSDVVEWEEKLVSLLPDLPHVTWTTSGPKEGIANPGRKGYSGVAMLHNLDFPGITITEGMTKVQRA